MESYLLSHLLASNMAICWPAMMASNNGLLAIMTQLTTQFVWYAGLAHGELSTVASVGQQHGYLLASNDGQQ